MLYGALWKSLKECELRRGGSGWESVSQLHQLLGFDPLGQPACQHSQSREHWKLARQIVHKGGHKW
jgi:hypothetical protein